MRYIFGILILTFIFVWHLADVAEARSRDRSKPKVSVFDEFKEYGIGMLLPHSERLSFDEVNEIPRIPQRGIIYIKEDEGAAGKISEKEINEISLRDAPPIEEAFAAYKNGEYDVALKGLLPWARTGKVSAQELLGLMYKMGQGIKKDSEQSVYWLLRAAENGSPLAQHHIGVMYFTGEGVVQDYVRALMWLRLAVEGYQDKDGRKRAENDMNNVSIRLTARDRRQAEEMVRNWMVEHNKSVESDSEDDEGQASRQKLQIQRPTIQRPGALP